MNVLAFKPKLSTSIQESRPPPGALAVGIDLGTTNSVVSVLNNEQTRPQQLLYDGMPLVPSIVRWNGVRMMVGNECNFDGNSSAIVRSSKRFMGLQFEQFQSYGIAMNAETAATHILKYLVGHPVLQEQVALFGKIWAVITVPAHFDDAARTATIAAAKQANINVLRIINEPTSAALAYSMLDGIDQTSRENLAIYDLGGGTFDVSIVERCGLNFQVKSSEGDIHLGGDDIDAATLLFLQNKYPAAAVTLQDAEVLKKQIQFDGVASLAHDPSVVIDRDSFNQIALPYIESTVLLTSKAITAARLKKKQVSRVLLVGGGTRLNLVRDLLAQTFETAEVDARLEPDLAVSWGASLQAAIVMGYQLETILVDVCTHSLGIGVAEDNAAIQRNFKETAIQFGISPNASDKQIEKLLNGKMEDFNNALQSKLRVSHIIHRNSPLPFRKSEFFTTLFENQRAVNVVLVQGEGKTVAENKFLGSFFFDLLQPCAAGSKCEIQLSYDVNSVVKVLAKQTGTDNIATANFDSRIGKILEWLPVESTVGVVSLASKMKVHSETHSQELQVTNALINRSFKILKKQQSESLRAMVLKYQKILMAARTQVTDEAELDALEAAIEAEVIRLEQL